MPATEETRYNQKVMHVVFGASALLMTVTTLWLLAKDHNREWKQIQLTDRHKEAWTLQAQHAAREDELSTIRDESEASLLQMQSQAIDPSLIGRFKDLVDDASQQPGQPQPEFKAVDAAMLQLNQAAASVAQAEADSLQELQEEAVAARNKLLDKLTVYVRQALRYEKQVVGSRKFLAADRTAAVSELGLKIGGGASQDQIEEVQGRIDGYDEQVAQFTEQIADAKTYRIDLEAVLKQIDGDQEVVVKQLGAMETELDRIEENRKKNTSNVFEWVTRWPILNALYDGNVRIDQIWLPDLTINFNFSHVARFDRCTTCHRSISQSAAGQPTEPAYPTLPKEERELSFALGTPDSLPEVSDDLHAALRSEYGLVLAEKGVFDYADVTVHYVLPDSAAAVAGLQSGDVIRYVGDIAINDSETVLNLLLLEANWGESANLTIERGYDHPYTTHPRLDLYLSDSSPHPQNEFGCTICHDGQGSGTEFPWTSHTPNDAEQQNDWARDYRWFDNHHWIFPMKPRRFAESNCLKCHFDKGGLESSERFPDPPAPKLVEGWTLVEEFGCFGCHEISGYDGPDKRVGPDLRLEPNTSEIAREILRDDDLTVDQQGWAETLVSTPDDDAARNRLFTSLTQGAGHKLAAGLKDVDSPGQYRKVGPSLRFLSYKVNFDWLYQWIKKPTNFRPTTRMPQYFGLHEHLQATEDKAELATSKRFEAVEIRAIAQFLLDNSDVQSNQFEYIEPSEVTELPSAERGKWLFESRGCLACHSHSSFPGIDSDQGPDLSRVAAKFDSEKGRRWLYSWLKKPNAYHARTRMPDLFLEPIVEQDATGQPTGIVTDPAADIRAFLMSVETDWQLASAGPWSPKERTDLVDLAQEWLSSDEIPAAQAAEYVRTGIPAHLEPTLKSDEKLLLEERDAAGQPIGRISEEQLVEYVARRSISKYGCFGCHDIPGFEDAKPIGTAQADWGRKDTSKLAFENILTFLASSHGLGHAAGDDHGSHGHLDPGDFLEDDSSYYIQALNSHARDGFIWQKLRQPRSFDYKTTKNKDYNERLRMPKFSLTDEQREAVITFVLGLVNEPPDDKYVYQPDTRQQAIVAGRQVLEKYNCAGCHTLRMERWQLAQPADQFESPPSVTDYPFLAVHYDDEQLAQSQQADARGLLHATVHGLPVINEETGQAELLDEDLEPLEPDDDESDPYYLFTLWQDALVAGESWKVGVQDLMIPADSEGYGPAGGKAWPAWGGDLTRYLYPRVIAHTKQTNPEVKGAEAWSWLPPPLMAEGDKVQLDWLHGFLMDPTALRPPVVMRMPDFHMSADDAEKLVNYFAAASGAQFPYEYKPRQRSSYLAQQEQINPAHLDEAMSIVVDGNYCVKCHAVGDFQPQGDLTTLGPNLAEVYRRLRPNFVRDWVANPKRILPYTGMPTNIPYVPDAPHEGGVSQDLYHGTSIQQLDGLVDLLMNFDVYAKRQTSIAPLVKQSPAAEPQTTGALEGAPSRR